MVSSKVIKEEGVVGTIFIPDTTDPRPAVIVLTGSNGGTNELAAKAFAEKGYVSLALAYFRADGVPDHLENIPLEYFLNAIQWLKRQPQVHSSKVHLYGASRGGELVLLLGSIFPSEISSIIAISPFCVTNGGVPDANMPAWTLKGKPLPIAPYPEEELVLKQLETQNAISFSILWLDVMKDTETFNNALIKVENIQCPILLISGKDDKMCPAYIYADLIMKRLDKFNSKIRKTHLCYENTGHIISTPSAPVITGALQAPYEYLGHKNFSREKISQQPSTRLFYEVGGTPEAQAAACRDSWEKILNFLSQ
jgi:dienelactone hydrolase